MKFELIMQNMNLYVKLEFLSILLNKIIPIGRLNSLKLSKVL